MNPILVIISLVMVGILFILIEFLLTPGIGIAGIVGLASFIGSCVYAFMVMGTKAGTITTAVVAVIVVILLVWMLRGKSYKKLELKAEIDAKINLEAESLSVGDEGKTLTRLAPMGTVRFDKLSCEAKSEDNTILDPGTPVVISSIEDNKVIVKPINN